MNIHSVVRYLSPLFIVTILSISFPIESWSDTDDIAKLDKKLSANGKSLETKINKARKDIKGRVKKKDWDNKIGKKGGRHPGYKAAGTHMPVGMALAVSAHSKKEGKLAETKAEKLALKKARFILHRQGKSDSPKDGKNLLDERNHQIEEINAELAKHSSELATQLKNGDEAKRQQIIQDAIHRHGEKWAKRKLVVQPQTMKDSEKEAVKRGYYTLLNHLGKNGGAR